MATGEKKTKIIIKRFDVFKVHTETLVFVYKTYKSILKPAVELCQLITNDTALSCDLTKYQQDSLNDGF